MRHQYLAIFSIVTCIINKVVLGYHSLMTEIFKFIQLAKECVWGGGGEEGWWGGEEGWGRKGVVGGEEGWSGGGERGGSGVGVHGP